MFMETLLRGLRLLLLWPRNGMCQLGSVGLDPAALVPTKVSVLHLCGGAVQTLIPFKHDVNKALFNAQPFTGFMGEGVKGKEE